MNRSIFCIPNGYTVFQERTTVDLDAAVNILKSRKRRKYISACRDDRSFTAELRKDLWKCPHCNYETAATLMEADSCGPGGNVVCWARILSPLSRKTFTNNE